jgi:hypothetical protein
MGCTYDKENGLWCDGEQDVIDDWLRKKFGRYDLEDEKTCEEIYKKIVTDKRLYNQAYNLVKKNFHRDNEPVRDMTDREFRNHLSFELGTPYGGDLPTAEDFRIGKVFTSQKRIKPMLPNYRSVITSGLIRRH